MAKHVMSSLVSAVSSFIYTELHDSYTTESVSYTNTVVYHAGLTTLIKPERRQ